MRCAETGSLNEGRGVNPGDSWILVSLFFTLATAQRRPGREPRRQRRQSAACSGVMSAQRRPGREPRRQSYTLKEATDRTDL